MGFHFNREVTKLVTKKALLARNSLMADLVLSHTRLLNLQLRVGLSQAKDAYQCLRPNFSGITFGMYGKCITFAWHL